MNGSQLIVTSYLGDAVDSFEIVDILNSAVIEGQQRSIFQVEYPRDYISPDTTPEFISTEDEYLDSRL